MRVTIDGQEQDLPVTLKRGTALQGAQLYVGDRQVTRVTHSLSDDIPVIAQVDELLIEIDPHDFYAIEGMDRDWQPGDQPELQAGI